MGRFRLWLLCFGITACAPLCSKNHSDMSAEEVLEAYLGLVFNMHDVQQKDDLLDFTTGELKAALAGATDEVLQEAYIKKRYELQRISIVERNDRTPRETEITYQLAYREIPPGETDFSNAPIVTTENTVSLLKEKGRLYLRAVLGNKTQMEFPISELSQIKAKAE
jgi:hypothetical protein